MRKITDLIKMFLIIQLLSSNFASLSINAQDDPGKLVTIKISKDYWLRDALKDAVGNGLISDITNLRIEGTMYSSDISDLKDMLLYGPDNGGPGKMKRLDLSDLTYINGNFEVGSFGQCVVDEFILPNSITNLDGNTFLDSRIKKLVIGRNVVSINEGRYVPGRKYYWSGIFRIKGVLSYQVAKGNSNFKAIDGVLYSADGKILEAYPNGRPQKTFRIPDDVDEIGACAFSGVTSLEEVDLNNVKVIGGEAFSQQVSIKKFRWGKKLKVIGDDAFFRPIEQYVIDDKSDREFVFPEGLEEIGNRTFYPTLGYKSFVFPSTIKKFGSRALTGDGTYYSDLRELDLSKCKDLEILPEQFCYYDSKLSSLKLPEDGKLKEIGHSAFMSCSGLKEIIIPNSVEKIDENAFFMYDEMTHTQATKVVLGSGIKNIESLAFAKMVELKEFTIMAVTPPTCAKDAFQGSSIRNAILYVPESSINKYKKDSIFSQFKAIKAILKEEKYAGSFKLSNDGLTLVKWIGDEKEINMNLNSQLAKVEVIGQEAFYENGNIESLIMSDKVKKIEWIAFAGSNLEKLVLSTNLIEISGQAFSRCMGLLDFQFPSKLKTIGERAFYRCNNLRKVTLSPSIVSLGDEAFSNCMNLQSVDFGKCQTNLGSSVFYFCSKLSNFMIDPDNGLYKLKDGILYSKDDKVLYCFPPMLAKEWVISDGTETIAKGAFSGVTELASISFPASLKKIGNKAFYFCKSLRSIDIPSGIVEIGDYAFSATLSMEAFTVSEENKFFKSVQGVLYSKVTTKK